MKKNIIIILSALFVVAALAVSCVFVFSGAGEKPKAKIPDLTGTWEIVAASTNDQLDFVQNQYIVFDSSTASLYREDLTEPSARSSYSVDGALNLRMPDVSREYVLESRSDMFIRLYESEAVYNLLVRTGDDFTRQPLTLDFFEGKWDVAVKGDQAGNGDQLVFSGSELEYFKGGSTEPYASAQVTLSETGELTASSLGLTLKCYRIDGNTAVMVEDTGTTWHICRIS